MIAPASSLFSSNVRNRRRAFGLVNALSALGLLYVTGIALPPIAAHAQAGEVPLPTFVLHLRPENAAPSQAALRERMLTRKASERAMTKTQRDEMGRNYVAGRATTMVDKQAANKLKMSDNALLAKIATKSKSDKSFLFAPIGTIQYMGPLSVHLTAAQPMDPTGKVSLQFNSPLTYAPADNFADFQNSDSSHYTEGSGSSKKTIYNPDSSLEVALTAQAGKTYLVVAEVSWGTFPFDAAHDMVDDTNGIGVSGNLFVTSSKEYDLSDSTEMMIPGGKPSTSMVIQCDKDGSYEILFAGLSNTWSFQGITIKEITP